jgi:hypothetical protein
MRFFVKYYLKTNVAIDFNKLSENLLQDIQKEYLINSDPIILDFTGVTVVFAIFYNRLLFNLISVFGLEKAGEIITFVNVPDENLFSSCKRHVWKYLTNSKYKKAVDLLHEETGDDFI